MKLRCCLWVLLLLVLLVLLPSQAVEVGELRDYCRKLLADWNVPGMAVAIVKDGELVLAEGYGVRELGKDDPADGDTLFAIASNTKAFTAGALAILVRDGKLNWDDRVQKHLPWFHVFEDPWISHEARVDDLLCHRVGFRTFSGDLIWWNTPYTAREVVERARFLEPRYGFRRGYGYSNIMFIAAGEVIGAASGETWNDFVRSRILDPLGMTNTALRVSELQTRPNVATPHGHNKDDKLFPLAWQAWDSTAAAGGIISSSADLAKWLRLQLNLGELDGHVYWTPEQAWKMWSIHNPFAFTPDGMEKNPEFSAMGAGLGWFTADYRGELIVRHGGGYDGMFSHTVMVPKKKIGIVVLSNSMTDAPRAAAFHTLDLLLGSAARDWSAELLKARASDREKKAKARDEARALRNPDSKPALPLKDYAGTYGGPMYGEATVSLENEKLVLRLLPNPDLVAELVHSHQEVFEVRWKKEFAWFGPGTVQFLLDREGQVAEFKLHVPNDDFWFEELEFKRQTGKKE